MARFNVRKVFMIDEEMEQFVRASAKLMKTDDSAFLRFVIDYFKFCYFSGELDIKLFSEHSDEILALYEERNNKGEVSERIG